MGARLAHSLRILVATVLTTAVTSACTADAMETPISNTGSFTEQTEFGCFYYSQQTPSYEVFEDDYLAARRAMYTELNPDLDYAEQLAKDKRSLRLPFAPASSSIEAVFHAVPDTGVTAFSERSCAILKDSLQPHGSGDARRLDEVDARAKYPALQIYEGLALCADPPETAQLEHENSQHFFATATRTLCPG